MAESIDVTSLRFTEEMKGHLTFGETDCRRGAERGRARSSYLMFHLTISTPDVDRFLGQPEHEAAAEGYVQCDALGGRRAVEKGIFNLFVDSGRPAERRMFYRLFLSDSDGRPVTLSGRKDVKDDGATQVWHDTSTLYTRLLSGHVTAEQEDGAKVLAAGILVIEKVDFLHQLTTFRVEGATLASRAAAARRFGQFFLGTLWDVYGIHAFPRIDLEPIFPREIPLYTLEGVRDVDVTTHGFSTGDKLGLTLQRFLRKPCDDVVMIVHGLTTSTDMFIMPEHYNLVSYLLDNGFTDVWTFDFRMSNRLPYNLAPHRYTMDDVALYDFPAALAELRRHVGDRRVHVICHCLGAVSFMMSLFGKAVTGISSVIANSVSLTPRVPRWSHVKLGIAPFLFEYVLGVPYLSPRWSEEPGLSRGKLLSKFFGLFHRECDVAACHMLSLMWGTGWPALYEHANLLDVTHRRGGDLYGGTSMHYYRHVLRMVRADNTAVKYDPKDARFAALPDNYLDYAAEIETPVLFMTGAHNRVFTDSNIECHRRLERIAPGRHQLHVFERYGHQDVFMGKSNHVDIFPRLLRFLGEQRRKHAPLSPVRREAAVGAAV